jgi:hypothetical protein
MLLFVIIAAAAYLVHAAPPKPTNAQLTWMGEELGAICSFNMVCLKWLTLACIQTLWGILMLQETFQYCGIGMPRSDPTSSIFIPDASTFAPTNVDTDQFASPHEMCTHPCMWVEALASLGVKRAVLVVSHGCGFNTFPSNTSFPEFGFVYNYSVKYSPWMDGQGDVARLFVDSCAKYGIRPGFCWSMYPTEGAHRSCRQRHHE